ncbi:MAG: cupin-like domain-containing protein [Actinomycetota bacterium]|nr:cupin-like domain-containing protein [Actinomycetota bacterium]MDQ2956323.1 cupin-like domain-containing protein [Actinomycetota bacterium]
MVATTPIAHVDAMDPAEFNRRYAEPAVPVVLRGATASWPALRSWSPAWLAARFGDRQVSVTFGNPLANHRETMTLGDYLGALSQTPDGGQPPYLRLQSLSASFPELRDDFTVPPYCPPGRNVAVHLWIGPAGTIQPFHKDNLNPLAAVHNLLVQVQGRKLVSLVSADQDEKMYRYPAAEGRSNYSQLDYLQPDLERFPLFGTATVAETVIEPGEMIFIPADTWHHVQSLEPSVSLSFWWYRTAVADLIARLALPESGSASPGQPAASIDSEDVANFGGIWALALAARTLPAERRPSLVDACAAPVAQALRTALDKLD